MAQGLAIGGAAIIGVLFVLPLGDDITKVASLVGTFFTGLLMVGALWWATRVNVGTDRVPWMATLGVYGIGLIVYALDPIEPGPAGGELSAAMFVGPFATVGQIAVVVVLARQLLVGRSASRVVLDAAWLGSASLLLSWNLVAAPVTNDADLTLAEKVALTTQLFAFAALIGLIVAVLAAVDRGSQRVFMLLVSPATLLGFALTSQARVVSTGTIDHGTFADFTFPLAFGIGAAAVFESRRATSIRGRKQVSSSVQLMVSLLPIVVWIALAALERISWTAQADIPGYFVGAIGLIRLAVLVQENSVLARDLGVRASQDHLTGLPNRRALTAIVDGYDNGHAALMLVDLDRFKTINDTLGYLAGDQLLVEAAQRIERAVGQPWTVTRLSGDEFVVVGGHECSVEELEETGRTVIAAISEPFELHDRELWVSATIGVATTVDGLGPDELLGAADLALRRAKQTARGQVVTVRAGFQEEAAERSETESALRAGIEKDELFCMYQPQVDLVSGALLGFEALVRWNRPGYGVVAPDDFIDIAEQSGLITRIDEWVLDSALHQLGRWNELDRSRRLTLSTNMSAWQLSRTDVHDSVARSIANNGRVDPSQLTIEVTETALVEAPEVVARRLQRLREVGVGVSIDDFGEGFTAIAYLRKFPVNEVKIDRTLVEPLNGGPADRTSLAAAVIALGGAMDLTVVAEGVETTEQARSLRLLGCRVAQGFLFAKPLPVEEVDRLVADSSIPLVPML